MWVLISVFAYRKGVFMCAHSVWFHINKVSHVFLSCTDKMYPPVKCLVYLGSIPTVKKVVYCIVVAVFT